MNMLDDDAKILSLLLAAIVLLLPVPLLSQSEKVAIVGEVNDTHQLVADSGIYEVADNEAGDRLVYDYIGQKVKVVGMLRVEGDVKVIIVISFQTVDE